MLSSVAPAVRRQGVGRASARSANSVARSASPSWSRSSPLPADYASAAQFSDGFAAAIGACAGLSLLGAMAGLALPRRQFAINVQIEGGKA